MKASPMTTTETPAKPPSPIDAYLDEAKTTLGAALTAIEVNHVDADAEDGARG